MSKIIKAVKFTKNVIKGKQADHDILTVHEKSIHGTNHEHAGCCIVMGGLDGVTLVSAWAGYVILYLDAFRKRRCSRRITTQSCLVGERPIKPFLMVECTLIE